MTDTEQSLDGDVPGSETAAASVRGPARGALSYSRVAILLHWLIALCLIGQIALGWRLHGIPDGAGQYAAFQLHKSIGISILLLSLGRLAWRLMHPAPPEEPMPTWQRVASTAVHWGLYAIMIGLPVTGWIMVSTSKLPIPTRLFGIVPWPAFPGVSGLEPASKAAWNGFGSASHATLAYLTVALLALHLGAVLKHQLLDKDRVFARMVPGALPGWKEPRFWGLAALAIAALFVGLSVGGATGKQGISAIRQPSQPAAAAAADAPPVSAVQSPSPAGDEANATPTPAAEAAGPTRWDVQNGKLGFTTDWSGTAISGSFSRWTADILFAPEHLDKSSLTVRIDLSSVSTGDSQRDAALPTSDWFDIAAHPSAVFRSTRIRAAGGDNYVAVGTLDLRGVRKSVSVPFNVTIHGDTASARGALTIDRTAFGIGQGDWSATDQIPAAVSVKFTLQAKARPTD